MCPDFGAFRSWDLSFANRADIFPTVTCESSPRPPGVALAQIALTMHVKALLVSAALLWPASLPAEQVAVRYTEGLVHGFLALRNMAGMALADGELLQIARGDRVTSHL